MMDFFEVLTRVITLGRERHPDAPAEHVAAFLHSVIYAVTGCSGSSMREHCANRLVRQAGKPGTVDLDRAVEVCERVCFGPLTVHIARMLELEHCSGDTLGDLEEGFRLLAEQARLR